MIQILIRFLVGGAVVSVFALIGDVLKPKSFAGLFGAAPLQLPRSRTPAAIHARRSTYSQRSSCCRTCTPR
jgi:hypothetical protein